MIAAVSAPLCDLCGLKLFLARLVHTAVVEPLFARLAAARARERPLWPPCPPCPLCPMRENKITFISVYSTLISRYRGETVKKIMLILIVAMLALAIAGCTSPSGTPTAKPTDTTPSAIPTQTVPTGTPAPTPWLSGYTKIDVNMEQPLVSQVTSNYEAVYHSDNWSMPHAMRTQYGSANHGAIYQIRFSNPTGSNQTIVAGYDIKSSLTYLEKGTGYRKMVLSSDVFYDPYTKEEYGEVKLLPDESREVYMLAYITNNTAYDAYGSVLDPKPGLDLNPQYVFGPI